MTDALPPGFRVTSMRAAERHTLRDWARLEGWNPGHHDIDIAWNLDPDAFLALRFGDELVGGGTIFSYDGAFGFMGLFIVRADHRGHGLGTALWHFRRDALVARLRPGASIGMDGVFDMVPFYARGGFELAYRDLRYSGVARGTAHPSVVDGGAVPFEQILELDRQHFPTDRARFLRDWLAAEGSHTAAFVHNGRLLGFGATRRCEEGHRFGPVVAADPEIADALVSTLMARIADQPVQLDVPEPNEAGVALARRFGLVESFGCARMYLGGVPDLAVHRIFGVTSFEFG